MWENMAPGTEFTRGFCAGIGPLQLGVVLVISFIKLHASHFNCHFNISFHRIMLCFMSGSARLVLSCIFRDILEEGLSCPPHLAVSSRFSPFTSRRRS